MKSRSKNRAPFFLFALVLNLRALILFNTPSFFILPILFGASVSTPASVTRTVHSYYKLENRELQGTLFLPDSGKVRPALMLIHEGGFTSGERHCFDAYGEHFGRRGMVVFSIDYRLVQQGGRYPEALKDAIEALCWLKGNAERFGVDKRKIVLAGSSAGAYLAAMTGLGSGLPDGIQRGHGGFPREDLRVAGVVCSFGLYDWEKSEWKGSGFLRNVKNPAEISPVSLVAHAGSPWLLLAGERDRLFPAKDQVLAFAGLLKKEKVPVDLHIMPKQKHGGMCELGGPIARWALPHLEKFLERVAPPP